MRSQVIKNDFTTLKNLDLQNSNQVVFFINADSENCKDKFILKKVS